MRLKTSCAIVATTLALTSVPAVAHHSFSAEFDITKTIKVTGKVSSVRWSNPHACIYVDVHVADGDTVILTRSKSARDGDIVLALVDGGDPVLRVYRKDGSRVRLEASGKTKPIISNSVQILGKAVAIIRKF